MEPHTNRQISALVALIKETANTIESHFTDSSLPSLDSLDSHALDTAVSPPLNDAIHILEGACVQLCATLARPSHTVLNVRRPASYFSYTFGFLIKQGALFALGVRGWNNAVQAAAVLSDFPWGQYPPGTIVNDVGGGIGTMAMELIKAFPNLLLKLQDRPKRIHQAETEVWPELLPSAIAEKRIEFKAIDFFVESPIEGCDVYYLKHILLHWSDEKCVRILRNIRAVLKPSACILLHDYVLQHTNRDDTRTPQADSALTLKEAPEPLLPNYGAGHVRQYNLDIAAMVLLNGRERTIEEFVDIAGKADLRFAKLWHTGEMAVLEFHPA
ncbi:Sterigmatocystin 8-O-methyltransferase [Termitomyces sp. T112]|nr:Sterigmatocystin 8-O-methyltransferase [Termitomyces sp. T112]